MEWMEAQDIVLAFLSKASDDGALYADRMAELLGVLDPINPKFLKRFEIVISDEDIPDQKPVVRVRKRRNTIYVEDGRISLRKRPRGVINRVRFTYRACEALKEKDFNLSQLIKDGEITLYASNSKAKV